MTLLRGVTMVYTEGRPISTDFLKRQTALLTWVQVIYWVFLCRFG